MAFPANVLRVMIASPSDTVSARDAVERALYDWNQSNSANRHVVLMPWRWETSAVPETGAHPQSLINAQGVAQSDIVIALFGSKLGTPTPAHVSGTVEEITEAEGKGVPVHIYFSTAPLPHDVDTEQLEGLRTFKRELQDRALYGEYASESELTFKVWKAIEYDLGRLELAAPGQAQSLRGVKFTVQSMREDLLDRVDDRGKSHYKTKHWAEVTNVGDVDAEQVTFEAVGDDSGMFVLYPNSPTTVHDSQSRRVGLGFSLGGADHILRISWVEDGLPKSQDFVID